MLRKTEQKSGGTWVFDATNEQPINHPRNDPASRFLGQGDDHLPLAQAILSEFFVIRTESIGYSYKHPAPLYYNQLKLKLPPERCPFQWMGMALLYILYVVVQLQTLPRCQSPLLSRKRTKGLPVNHFPNRHLLSLVETTLPTQNSEPFRSGFTETAHTHTIISYVDVFAMD